MVLIFTSVRAHQFCGVKQEDLILDRKEALEYSDRLHLDTAQELSMETPRPELSFSYSLVNFIRQVKGYRHVHWKEWFLLWLCDAEAFTRAESSGISQTGQSGYVQNSMLVYFSYSQKLRKLKNLLLFWIFVRTCWVNLKVCLYRHQT